MKVGRVCFPRFFDKHGWMCYRLVGSLESPPGFAPEFQLLAHEPCSYFSPADINSIVHAY